MLNEYFYGDVEDEGETFLRRRITSLFFCLLIQFHFQRGWPSVIVILWHRYAIYLTFFPLPYELIYISRLL